MKNKKIVFMLFLMNFVLCSCAPQKYGQGWFPFHIKLPKPPPQVEKFFCDIPMNAKNILDNVQSVLPSPLRSLFTPGESRSMQLFPQDLVDNVQNALATPFKRLFPQENKQMDKSINAHEHEIPPMKEEHGMHRGIGRDIVRNIVNRFNTSENKSSNAFVEVIRERVQPIYPGTQWCGSGSRATSYEELGLFSKADACCRQHDSCPVFIEQGSEAFGLKNTGLFTRSHCDCDTEFYECLKHAHDVVASQIGTTYFTALGPQCFKMETKITGCKKKHGLTRRCTEYTYENSTVKMYQWFDNPEF